MLTLMVNCSGWDQDAAHLQASQPRQLAALLQRALGTAKQMVPLLAELQLAEVIVAGQAHICSTQVCETCAWNCVFRNSSLPMTMK